MAEKGKKTSTISPAVRASLVKWYGPESGMPRNTTKPLRSASMARSRMKPASASCFPCFIGKRANFA